MENSGVYQLFVYGSLRSGFQNPAYEYISRFFEFVGNAKVKGLLYDLGEYAAAVPGEGEHFIIGELYRIKSVGEFGWAMAQLDDYEGIITEDGEKAMYRRDVADVYVGDTRTPAWIYWYNDAIIDKPLVSSGDIVQYLQQKK